MFHRLVLPHLITGWLTLAGARLCWEDCGGEIVPENVDILDCRRRSTYPELEDFRCEGKVGPPCTVFNGDDVEVMVEWKNPGLTNLKQSIHWDSPVVPLPWVGLDREVCPYLDGADTRRCYQCTGSRGGSSEHDNCGEFSSVTATCETHGSCVKTRNKNNGVLTWSHGCDGSIGGNFCTGQEDKCRTGSVQGVEGVTICCCQGELCNYGALLKGSVVLVISVFSIVTMF